MPSFLEKEVNILPGGMGMKSFCLAKEFLFFALIFCIEVIIAHPKNLNGTCACLKDKHKDLSIIHGAIACEKGVIQNMYDFGALGSKGDKISSETIKLVAKLFNRPPGSSGASGFLVTKPVRELPNRTVAEWVAAELVFFKRLPQLDCFKNYQKQCETYDDFVALSSGSGPDSGVQKTSEKKIQQKLKSLETAVSQARRAVLTAFDTSTEHPLYTSPLKELAHYPIKAFLECVNNEYLFSTMPQTVLQALLYKKTEGDRAAFRIYYEWLDTRLGCLAYPLPATWEQDIFMSEQRESMLRELPLLSSAQAYEQFAFLKLSPTDYPPLIPYGDVMLQSAACSSAVSPNAPSPRAASSSVAFSSVASSSTVFPDVVSPGVACPGAPFTDCMENTLRNISNFLAYNQQTGLFDGALLEARLGTQVHERVKRFYAQYDDPSEASSKNAHNAWVEILSTLPNIVYCRALPAIGHQKKDCIKVGQQSPLVQNFLTKKGYEALPEYAVAYDMRPSLKNCMLACDYLFGLKLFDTLSADAWAQEGFVATQFPRFVMALKAQVPASLDYAELEEYDGTLKDTYVPLAFSFAERDLKKSLPSDVRPDDQKNLEKDKPYTFTLTLHTAYDDGEILFNQPQSVTSELSLPVVVREQLPDSALFMESYLALDKKSVSAKVLAWIFAQNLDERTRTFALVQQVPVFNEHILDVLLFSARKGAINDTQQTLRVLRLYDAALQRGLIARDTVVKAAIDEASRAAQSHDAFVRGEALHLFKTLFMHNKGVDAAVAAAQTWVQSPTIHDVSAGVALLKALTESGKAGDVTDNVLKARVQSPEKIPAGIRFEVVQLADQRAAHYAAQDTQESGSKKEQETLKQVLVRDVQEKLLSEKQHFLKDETQQDGARESQTFLESEGKSQYLTTLFGALGVAGYLCKQGCSCYSARKARQKKTNEITKKTLQENKKEVLSERVKKSVKRELLMNKLAALACFFSVSMQANINAIKDTYTILKPQFRDLSIIHGAVAAETDFLPTLYALGDERKKSATVSLVKKIFHKTFGKAGAADLVVTKDIRLLDEEKSISFVASLLMLLRDLPHNSLYAEYNAIAGELRTARALKKEDAKIQGIEKKIDKLQRQLAKQRGQIITTCQALTASRQFAEPFKKLLPAAIEAHLECALEKRFAPTTVPLVLLALLYKETECSKRFVRLYYEELNKQLHCLEGALDATWQASQFSLASLDSLSMILGKEPLEGAFLESHFEEYVFARLARTIPIAHYQEAVFKEHEFTDCMDTAVRNMLNNLVYNPEIKKFDTAVLEKRLSTKVRDSLEDFYEKYKDPATVTELSVHNAWAHVSSNVPWIAYNRALLNGELKVLPMGKRGFIKVDVQAQETATLAALVEKGYVPIVDSFVGQEPFVQKEQVIVAPHADVFTVKPTLKNMIVLLDNLLNLNLFNGKVVQEFLRDDCVALYLPRLAAALHATVPTVTEADKRDFSDELLVTTFDFNFTEPKPYSTVVTLLTESRHGVLEFCSEPLAKNVPVLTEPLKEPYPSSLPLLAYGAEKVL